MEVALHAARVRKASVQVEAGDHDARGDGGGRLRRRREQLVIAVDDVVDAARQQRRRRVLRAVQRDLERVAAVGQGGRGARDVAAVGARVGRRPLRHRRRPAHLDPPAVRIALLRRPVVVEGRCPSIGHPPLLARVGRRVEPVAHELGPLALVAAARVEIRVAQVASDRQELTAHRHRRPGARGARVDGGDARHAVDEAEGRRRVVVLIIVRDRQRRHLRAVRGAGAQPQVRDHVRTVGRAAALVLVRGAAADADAPAGLDETRPARQRRRREHLLPAEPRLCRVRLVISAAHRDPERRRRVGHSDGSVRRQVQHLAVEGERHFRRVGEQCKAEAAARRAVLPHAGGLRRIRDRDAVRGPRPSDPQLTREVELVQRVRRAHVEEYRPRLRVAGEPGEADAAVAIEFAIFGERVVIVGERRAAVEDERRTEAGAAAHVGQRQRERLRFVRADLAAVAVAAGRLEVVARVA